MAPLRHPGLRPHRRRHLGRKRRPRPSAAPVDSGGISARGSRHTPGLSPRTRTGVGVVRVAPQPDRRRSTESRPPGPGALARPSRRHSECRRAGPARRKPARHRGPQQHLDRCARRCRPRLASIRAVVRLAAPGCARAWFGSARGSTRPSGTMRRWPFARPASFLSSEPRPWSTPAASLAPLAKAWAPRVIEINPDETPLSASVDASLRGPYSARSSRNCWNMSLWRRTSSCRTKAGILRRLDGRTEPGLLL